jgi:hypothetical protein
LEHLLKANFAERISESLQFIDAAILKITLGHPT